MTDDSDEAYKRGQRDQKIASLEKSGKELRDGLGVLEKRQRKMDFVMYAMTGIIGTLSAKVTGLIEVFTGNMPK